MKFPGKSEATTGSEKLSSCWLGFEMSLTKDIYTSAVTDDHHQKIPACKLLSLLAINFK